MTGRLFLNYQILFLSGKMSRLSEFSIKTSLYYPYLFRYSISAAIKNTGGHFIAIIKSNNNVYYCFNDLDPSGCVIHDGSLIVDFAIYTLKI